MPREELAGFMARRDFGGVNVTIPYKTDVIPMLDYVSDEARAIGAVNTVVNRGGRLYGYNTDFFGMRELLIKNNIPVCGSDVLILGTGGTSKTAKAVCESLGVPSEEISSPTFSIVNEYVGDDGCSIYHFDFYRITKDAEALDIGLYDYLDSGCPCLMEWPENIENLLPEDTLKVTIHVEDDGTREVCWED